MRKQKLTFRQEETHYVFKRWFAQESCSLIGVGSIGKSNLMHHLADNETIQHYLKESEIHRAIIVDANMLGALPSWNESNAEQFRCWAGYELIMHRIYLDFYPLDVLDADAETFFETYQALQDGTNPLYQYMGIRYLELGLAFFARRNIHLLLMFDEFEELLKQMPARFFLALRGLRDRYKKQISFLTFSRLPLPQLLDSLGLPKEDYEPFVELFSDNIYYVGPYSPSDTMDMLKNLQNRHQMTLPPILEEHLINITGGYAGLLRASFHGVLVMKSASTDESTLLQELLKREAVQLECNVLWESLSTIEQKVLMSLAQTGDEQITITDKPVKEAIEKLVLKRLIQVNKATQRLYLHPTLFAHYIYYRLH